MGVVAARERPAGPPQADQPEAPEDRRPQSGGPEGISFVLIAGVLIVMLLAGALRLAGLVAPDGSLNTDEARLTLAADGVPRTGLPIMPSGRVYTRGLLNAYAIAGSFALFGRHDFTARLPSVVAGVLLVPVVFLLARVFGGTAAGLAAAVFAALAEPLVYYSRSAWLPSIFQLLFTATVYCCYRGFVEGRGRWQVVGAACFCLALLSYEFALLVPVGLGLFLVARLVRRDRGWYAGRSTLLAVALFVGGLALFGALALTLRVGTLAGPLGELRAWFIPRLALSGMAYYLKYLLSDYLVLIGIIVLSLPLLLRARPRGTVYLLGLLLLAFLVPSFVTQLQRSPRYALPMLPLLAVLAAAGAVRLARLAGRRLPLVRPLRSALPIIALVLAFELALWGDVTASRVTREPLPRFTWLQVLQEQGLQPTDLLVFESANKAQFYLGRCDFFVRPVNYERYAYPDGETLRDVYTGAVLLVRPGDFERLVEAPNPGRVVWVVGRELPLRNTLQMLDPNLWPSLLASADHVARAPDGFVVLRLTTPRHAVQG